MEAPNLTKLEKENQVLWNRYMPWVSRGFAIVVIAFYGLIRIDYGWPNVLESIRPLLEIIFITTLFTVSVTITIIGYFVMYKIGGLRILMDPLKAYEIQYKYGRKGRKMLDLVIPIGFIVATELILRLIL